ncbi:methyltransferase [Frigidibacter sp. RF13]|uniref:tRNA1(Val) (adenine(37)-N6)-methyltransferase n=1 Tax=Frigidibacter sp. RF13 TaxID=2997340 RepID=UPI00226E15E0|nr:methyltransferase [Frigidibacter sp. RF13]MCY1128149.1 methyltransferase [Frigidibacter sp. RF13]
MAEAKTTSDGFLGGRLSILQPKDGYRAATDPVFLAAAAPVQPGDSVLELGCGVGVASLCLLSRVPEVRATGIERQADYAALADRNARQNGLPLEVITGDLTRPPPDLRALSFDQVIANPPFFRAGDGTGAQNPGREIAFREEAPLSAWIDAGLRRLRPGGWLTMIHLSERLADILTGLEGRAGSVSILPLVPRAGRPASRVIVRARKTGKAPLRLLSPFILHAGAAHLADGDDFTPEARAVLRDGAALPGFD